jgi:hypothetical protein
MRLAVCLSLFSLVSGAAFAQKVTRSFGSVVFPGGTSAINPNITRTFGSVVFPGGSPASLPVRSGPVALPPAIINNHSSFGVSSGNSFNRGGMNGGNSFHRPGGVPNRGGHRAPTVYAYPVYVPGYYDAPVSQDMVAPPAQPVQQPNVTVVYPQQQETARPIIIQMGGDEVYPAPARRPAPRVYAAPEEAATAEPETQHYLIAFKDHSIYTTVAYWFDGDTLHYFTKGDTHNQAPVGLIDRPLTERLNRELGIDFKMPAAK